MVCVQTKGVVRSLALAAWSGAVLAIFNVPALSEPKKGKVYNKDVKAQKDTAKEVRPAKSSAPNDTQTPKQFCPLSDRAGS
jgi:hypothetical protein